MRLPFLSLAAAAVLLLSSCRRPAAEPNLLLVTIDTLRRDHVGAYGDGKAATPTLDQLAGAGVLFDAASSNAPLTLVSHATLLSGLLPPHHGLRNNGAGSFPADRDTLATSLSAAGYRTGAFVGAFVLDRRFGLSRGFDVYDDEIERQVGRRPSLEEERRGDQVVDRALAWLSKDAAGAERPFFLWVHLYDPHAPYDPPEPYRGRFPGDPYRGEIAFADAQVGRLLAELERRGEAGNTVVAVAADHGEGLGDHGEATHGLLLYEPTIAVPLLVRGPDLPARKVKTPVGLVDLAPTLAGLVGHPFPTAAKLDGRDLSAALRKGDEPAAGEVYSETRYPEMFGWSPLSALRRRAAKYIAAPTPELYDLASDPGEARNLARLPQSAGSTKGFADRLAALESSAVHPAAAPVDAETAARLASLGYVAGNRPAAPSAPGGRLPDPKERVALFERFEAAYADLRTGQTEKAVAALQELAAADPGNAVFRSRLAQALREGGRAAAAIPVLREAANAAPADPDVWYDLAVALQDAGQSADARAALEHAIKLDDSRPDPHNTLGVLLLAEGKMEPALAELNRAVAIDPRHGAALNNLGNALRGLHRPAEAEAAYRRAIAAAPRYAEAWNGLGALLVEVDRPREALPCFDEALRLAPGYLEVLINQGIAREQSGDPTGAADAYRRFLAAAGNSPSWTEQRRAATALLARLSAGPS